MGGHPRTKRRGPHYIEANSITLGIARSWWYNGHSWVELPPTTYKWPAIRLTTDYKVLTDELHSGPPWKDGGPLLIQSKNYPIAVRGCNMSFTQGSSRYEYNGSFVLNRPFDPLQIDYAALQPGEAFTYGAEGWNKFRPVKPYANLGQFLGELRDFPRMIQEIVRVFRSMGRYFNRTSSARDIPSIGNIGSGYLGYRFGWAPFVSDLLKFYKLNKDLERRLLWIRKNNNKWISRGGVISQSQASSAREVACCLYPTLNTAYYNTPVVLETAKVKRKEVEKIWFKARMKYYIPEGDFPKVDDVFPSALVRHLYGLTLTPALCWELLPWSWLADWFSGIGTVLSNISNAGYDNLVAKYAYVMRTKTVEEEWDQSQTFKHGSVHVSTTHVVELKERAVGSQFGFGGSGTLTARQVAILAALGLQRYASGH